MESINSPTENGNQVCKCTVAFSMTLSTKYESRRTTAIQGMFLGKYIFLIYRHFLKFANCKSNHIFCKFNKDLGLPAIFMKSNIYNNSFRHIIFIHFDTQMEIANYTAKISCNLANSEKSLDLKKKMGPIDSAHCNILIREL